MEPPRTHCPPLWDVSDKRDLSACCSAVSGHGFRVRRGEESRGDVGVSDTGVGGGRRGRREALV